MKFTITLTTDTKVTAKAVESALERSTIREALETALDCDVSLRLVGVSDEYQDDEFRDRATHPRLGDTTSCRHCGDDIQYQGREHGWRDRGGNRTCNHTNRHHKPTSDRG